MERLGWTMQAPYAGQGGALQSLSRDSTRSLWWEDAVSLPKKLRPCPHIYPLVGAEALMIPCSCGSEDGNPAGE